MYSTNTQLYISFEKQYNALVKHATLNAQLGNNVLSTWIQASAQAMHKKAIEERMNTDRILDDMEYMREIYRPYETEKQSFRSDWYDYEDEYLSMM